MGHPSVTKNSKNVKLKKGYPTLNNKAAKIKRGYIVKNNKWQKCFALGLEFTYTGQYKFEGNPEADWAISFLTSGELKILSIDGNIDLFIAGAGENPGRTPGTNGNRGGNGGRLSIFKNRKIAEGTYEITIGENYKDSSFGALYSSKDGVSKIGPPGGNNYNGSDGTDGEPAFGEAGFTVPGFTKGYKFGATGGSGAGVAYDQDYRTGGAKGESGGGKGGDAGWNGVQQYGIDGGDADDNSAGGGGGGGSGNSDYAPKGGKGGNGIIVARNAR